MTPRELREVVFYFNNQDMTVKELRALLFEIDEQDKPLDIRFGMWAKLEAAAEDEKREQQWEE